MRTRPRPAVSPTRRSQRLSTAASSSSSSSSSSPLAALLSSGYFYMALLALQYGCQPLLVKAFTPKSLPKMPIVMVTEAVKIVVCFTGLLLTESKASRQRMYNSWTLKESFRLAAIPAALYALQNTMAQYGYQYLDSLTFNLLNQTKVRLHPPTHPLTLLPTCSFIHVCNALPIYSLIHPPSSRLHRP